MIVLAVIGFFMLCTLVVLTFLAMAVYTALREAADALIVREKREAQDAKAFQRFAKQTTP